LDSSTVAGFRHGAGAPLVSAQTTGTVKGVCKDADGNPIVQGEVEWTSSETGHKYDLKTNKKGEYFSLGISPASTTSFSRKTARNFSHQRHHGRSGRNHAGHRLEERTSGRSPGPGIDPEQAKARQEANSKAEADKKVVGTLNDKLKAARTAEEAKTMRLRSPR